MIFGYSYCHTLGIISVSSHARFFSDIWISYCSFRDTVNDFKKDGGKRQIMT